MNIEKFEEKVIEYLKEEYGKNTKIVVKEVVKNNGVKLRGITVMLEGMYIAPTFYVEDLFEAYENGVTFSHICENFVKTIEDAKEGASIDLDFLDSYETAKDRIFCKLINKQRNEELLMDVPHVDFLDLSIVFYVVVKNGIFGEGSILISNSEFKRFKVSMESFTENAKKNTIEKLGIEILTIQDVLIELLKRKLKNGADPEMIEEMIKEQEETRGLAPMYVISNEFRTNGAACLLNTEALMDFSEEIEDDFYVLPSSIHELIFIPKKFCENVETLREMVVNVNGTEVEEKEVLSDLVYCFERGNGVISIA